MSVKIDASFGELIDKLTILEIKSERITKPEALMNVQTELALLRETEAAFVPDNSKLLGLYKQLRDTNIKLWEIEDNIRNKERNKEFDAEFIEYARSVYLTNDRRCDIKRLINELLGSEVIEEKSYAKYSSPEDH